jgi:hypothetical protein
LRDIRSSPGTGQTRADDLVLFRLDPQRRCPRCCYSAKILNREIRYWNIR